VLSDDSVVELLVKPCSVELDDDELVVKLKNVDEELKLELELELLDEDDTEVELLDDILLDDESVPIVNSQSSLIQK